MQKKTNDTAEKETERDELLDAIGNRIKLARTVAGLTQKELAGLLSTNQSWIYMVEDGQQNLQLSSLRKIAQILKVSVRDLMPENSDANIAYKIDPEITETFHKLVAQITNAILKILTDAEKPDGGLMEGSSRAKKSTR